VCWCGSNRVHVEQVPDARILDGRDVVVRTRLTTVCGSDLHLFGGYIAGMKKGDILGHELVGEVVEVGGEVRTLRRGDRVVVSPVIACGACWHCKGGEFSLCDNTNPNAGLQEQMTTYPTAGVFGFSHLYGGYAGCQAEFVRVPYADVICFKLPDGMTDEQGLACSDVLPTGYMGADLAGIQKGDVVAVWGCGPVGLMAMKSAALLGAGKVVAIDNLPERLDMAARFAGALPLNHDHTDVVEGLKALTGGRGPDRCIDAVGMEAHGTNLVEHVYDRAKQFLMLEHDRPAVARQAITACRKGGTVVFMGVYTGLVDKFPLGLVMTKSLTLRTGNLHGPKYIPRVLEHCRRGDVDPAFVFTHRMALDDAPNAYRMFRDKEDRCVKVALHP
jgi:threonine dehydrogenase-like Zn-dependent dehydrogenase